MFSRNKKEDAKQQAKEIMARQEEQKMEYVRQKILDARAYLNNPNAVLSDGYRLLEKTMRDRDIDGVMKCLSDGADPNLPFRDETSALCYVLSNVNKDQCSVFVEALLLYGADPNGGTKDGSCPLEKAYHKDCQESFVLLLQHGARADFSRSSNRGAIYDLIRNEKRDYLELVARHSLDKFSVFNAVPAAVKEYTSWQAFHHNYKTLFWQAAMKADNPYKNKKDGQSFLHDLVQRGKEQQVHELVEKHGYQEARNHQGRSLLHVAVAQKQAYLTGYLLSKGADPYAVDDLGYNAMDIAIENNAQDHVVSQILAQKKVVPRVFQNEHKEMIQKGPKLQTRTSPGCK